MECQCSHSHPAASFDISSCRPSLCSCWTMYMEWFTSVCHWLLVTSHLKKYLDTNLFSLSFSDLLLTV